MPEPTVILAIVGMVVVWPALAFVLKYMHLRRRQQRLNAAFDRGRRVMASGTGELGQPRPLHGENYWSDRRSG